MASKSKLTYDVRAAKLSNPIAKRLLSLAAIKKTNIVISADVRSAEELLSIADRLGPYIAVFKTHIDLIADCSAATITTLEALSVAHNFLIFEDSKFTNIGHVAQQQYHGGLLKISEWAHIVSASVLAGEGTVQALAQTADSDDFPYSGDRAMIVLAEMTGKGSLAQGAYTAAAVDISRKHKGFVVGFMATRSLATVESSSAATEDEDFIVFTPGVNKAVKDDLLGQQYKSPASAIAGGADFIIVGRGIYGAADPVATVKSYQEEGWQAYLARAGQR